MRHRMVVIGQAAAVALALSSPAAKAQRADSRGAELAVQAQAGAEAYYLASLYEMSAAAPLTPEQREELERRAAEYFSNGAAVTSVPSSGPAASYFQNGAEVLQAPTASWTVVKSGEAAGAFGDMDGAAASVPPAEVAPPDGGAGPTVADVGVLPAPPTKSAQAGPESSSGAAVNMGADGASGSAVPASAVPPAATPFERPAPSESEPAAPAGGLSTQTGAFPSRTPAPPVGRTAASAVATRGAGAPTATVVSRPKAEATAVPWLAPLLAALTFAAFAALLFVRPRMRRVPPI